jgi:hypothetical protein
MDPPPSTGDLVKVATRGPTLDGIVFDVPSASKVVVAVMDRGRGPVLRAVRRDALSPRAEASPDDQQLRLLIRRTHVQRGSAHAGGTGGPGGAGHRRAAGHRTTGK